MTANQIGRQFRHLIVTLPPAELDCNILSLGESSFVQALSECRHLLFHKVIERSAAEKSDHRYRRLLRTHHRRPSRRPSEKGNKISSPHIPSLPRTPFAKI